MILHIVPDDKFIDIAYNMFEKISPNNNEFMVVTKVNRFKYIKTAPITKVNPFEFMNKNFIKNLDKYEFIVLHWLDFFKMKLLLKAPKNIKFVWIGWGGDYYDYIKLPSGSLLMSDTHLLAKKLSKNRVGIKNILKRFIKKIALINHQDIKAINRIDYFAPVLENEYKLMQEAIENFSPKFIDWNYGTLEDDLIKGYQNLHVNGNNILIGNSATLPNNHLEALDILKNIDTTYRTIIMPLSYGDMQYADMLIKKGKELFGGNFKPLIDFMPIEDYIKIISSCSIVIMNHLRQQAVGNIIIMLYLGAKVFLNKENPAYTFFKNQHVNIFSLDDLEDSFINKKLDDEQVHENRMILQKLWGRETALLKTKVLIETARTNN